MKKPELVAPAGDWTMLTTAVKSGADAVYFGLNEFNMRAKAANFDLKNITEVVDYCKSNNVKTHLTVNTIIYQSELERLYDSILIAKNSGIDMIICWDAAVIQKCREIGIPFCISTQASVSNAASAQFYKNLGANRIVLARECSLNQMKEIVNKVDIEIESFIHGAMCVAISGRCFMSQFIFDKSANRGECIQPCRREYEIYEKTDDYLLLLGEDYVLSPKDLCSINFIDKLIEAEIDAFKIEGRKRSPEYISTVVSTYRKAIDLYFEGKLTDELKSGFYEDLCKVYNRGFSEGFYFSPPGDSDYARLYGSKATTRKKFIGKVINFFKIPGIAHIKLEAGDLKIGEKIYIIGNKTGVIEKEIDHFLVDDIDKSLAIKGEEITFKCSEQVRVNDKVYKIIEV